MPSIKNIIKLKKKYDAPTIDELPTSYKTNTDKERLYLWAANNFHHQIQVSILYTSKYYRVCQGFVAFIIKNIETIILFACLVSWLNSLPVEILKKLSQNP